MKSYNPFSLQQKSILVTGASSGIGKAIAIECSKAGANVIITGRNTERLKETFDSLAPGEHISVSADLSTQEGRSILLKEVDIVHGIVHSIGIVHPKPFPFVTEEYIDNLFNVNYKASVLLTQQLLKQKKIQSKSSVVFISSISGVFCSYLGGSIYSSTKGAIHGLVKGMALDLAPKGIRVNCINPGMVRTNILAEGIITSEQMEEDRKKYPLKRYGKPEEVGYAAIYLLSDASIWVTGTNLLIDGGYTLT